MCWEGFRAPGKDGCTGDPPVTASPSPLTNHAEKTSHHLAAVLPQAPSTAPSVHQSPSPGGRRQGDTCGGQVMAWPRVMVAGTSPG